MKRWVVLDRKGALEELSTILRESRSARTSGWFAIIRLTTHLPKPGKEA
jgi:hypothetical protein